MIYITDIDFRKLSLIQRYKLISEHGLYIAKRRYRSMEVFLYKIDGLYVEVWKRFMISEVEWIELAPKNFVEIYADAIDLRRLMSEGQ